MQPRDRLLAWGIDMSPYELGHLAFRVPEWDQYVLVRTLLERHVEGLGTAATGHGDGPEPTSALSGWMFGGDPAILKGTTRFGGTDDAVDGTCSKSVA